MHPPESNSSGSKCGPQRSTENRTKATANSGAAADLNLVVRAQAGDRRAFDQLTLKYRPQVMALAVRYMRNRADAEDVTQEAFMSAYNGLYHFRRESSFYTWLYRITVNSAKNLLMARARYSAAAACSWPSENGAATMPIDFLATDTPEELACAEEMRGAIDSTLARLPDVHRDAILLREVEGLTYEQIAATMATPVGTVRSRIFRARDFIDLHLRPVFESGLGRGAARRLRPTATA